MKTTPADQRAARLAAALRENLKRRKQQARGRQATTPDDSRMQTPSETPKDEFATPDATAPRTSSNQT